jgi:diguanylate cyclase (GGDEF)-like protein
MNSEHVCPAGAKECSLLEEIAALRERCRKLEELSYQDALTGLYNFRHLQRSLEMEMARTRRSLLPTSLIMLDLDHFKNVNTLYGHEAGNSALADISRICREGVRIIDIPCRYGGEEFALIMPSTSLLQASHIAERLRVGISAAPIILNDQQVTITASFGVAVFRHTDNYTVSEFLRKADALLYQAKASGRNRVCTEQMPQIPPSEVTVDERTGLFAPIEDEEKIE